MFTCFQSSASTLIEFLLWIIQSRENFGREENLQPTSSGGADVAVVSDLPYQCDVFVPFETSQKRRSNFTGVHLAGWMRRFGVRNAFLMLTTRARVVKCCPTRNQSQLQQLIHQMHNDAYQWRFKDFHAEPSPVHQAHGRNMSIVVG